MVDFLQNCLDGVMRGSGYALLGIGFTLIFGVMRRLNLSYGPSIMLGGFAGTLVYINFGAPLFLVAIVTILGATVAGIYVERLCFRAVGQGAALASMVSSFAIWMQLEEVATIMLPERTYPFPAMGSLESLTLGPFFLKAENLLMFGIAIALVAALEFLLRQTRYGLALRAVTQHSDAAHLLGINVHKVTFLAFALASAIGGAAGFLILATDSQITPMFGLWATFKGLIAMMLGGMGSIPGAILGGLLLGVVETQALWYLGAQYRDLATYLLLFSFLVLRPGGLFGQVLAAREKLAWRRV